MAQAKKSVRKYQKTASPGARTYAGSSAKPSSGRKPAKKSPMSGKRRKGSTSVPKSPGGRVYAKPASSSKRQTLKKGARKTVRKMVRKAGRRINKR